MEGIQIMRRILMVTIFSMVLTAYASISFAYEKEIKAISAAMMEKMTKAGKKNIAVVDLTDLQGNVTELGRFLAEEISSELSAGATGFEIVDRSHLKSIFAEHKFSQSGLVDPGTIKQLGQIAGVDAIVTGTVTPFGDSIRISGKVIATDTAKVIATAKGDIAKTKAIEELLEKGIETGEESSVVKSSAKQAPKTAKASKRPKNSSGAAEINADFLGSWAGTGKQSSNSIYWPITLSITLDDSGRVVAKADYPSLSCGGDLILQKAVDNSLEFLEILSYGQNKCDNKGVFVLKQLGRSFLDFSWTSENGKHTAAGTLKLKN